MNIDIPVVIWGFYGEYMRQNGSLPIASHAYIHAGYRKAFASCGYNVQWLDDTAANAENVPVGAVVFCMNTRAVHLPRRPDLFYIGHNLEPHQTADIEQSQRMGIQYWVPTSPGEEIEPYARWEQSARMLHMPWATDLLPSEIKDTVYAPDSQVVYWVGSVWSDKDGNGREMGNMVEFDQMREAFGRHRVRVDVVRAWDSEHARYIQSSRVAPVMQGAWQVNYGYIPCRAFKNASYGQLVVTNNPIIRDLFNGQCVYESDIGEMVESAMKCCCRPRELMTRHAISVVRDGHTYVHRVKTLMGVVEDLL